MHYVKGMDSNGMVMWLNHSEAWTDNPEKAKQFRLPEAEKAVLQVILRNRNLDRSDMMEPSIVRGFDQ